jgi:hypothetical protein
VTTAALISGLERTRAATLEHFQLDDERLARTYGPGKWSVRYVLHHLADSETILYYRIRRVISEPKQVIWVFDQAAWADRLDYSTTPLSIAQMNYAAAREGVLYYAGRHYERDGGISFVHSETGLRTLKDEFDKVVSHNEKHLEQIAAALAD